MPDMEKLQNRLFLAFLLRLGIFVRKVLEKYECDQIAKIVPYSDTIINNTISQIYSEHKQINIIDTDEKEKRTKYI